MADGVEPDSWLEHGVSITKNRSYVNPWNDSTGVGTALYQKLRGKFTRCVSFVPIKWEYSIDTKTLNQFTLQHCRRKKKSRMCVIFTQWGDLKGLELPVVTRVDKLLKMVDQILVEAHITKDGKRSRTYHFAAHVSEPKPSH